MQIRRDLVLHLIIHSLFKSSYETCFFVGSFLCNVVHEYSLCWRSKKMVLPIFLWWITIQRKSRSPPGSCISTLHHLGAGKVNYEAVPVRMLRTWLPRGKYGADFIRYWVDTAQGDVYCLVSAYDTASVVKTHAEAHGLITGSCISRNCGIGSSGKRRSAFIP